MAIATSADVELTPEDLLDLPDSVGYELVDGRLIKLSMGSLSQYYAARLTRLLGAHCDESGMAHVFVESGYVCFAGKPNRMRRPDVSCVRADRLPFDQIGQGFLKIRPDLAAEVISPGDKVIELEEKLDDYRSAGIPLVWLTNPNSRRVRIIRLVGPTTDLGPDDELTGEDILPGFRCRVAELFAGPVALGPRPAG